jgi:hypothetical protein
MKSARAIAEEAWLERYPEVTETIRIEDYVPDEWKRVVGCGPQHQALLLPNSFPTPEYYVVRSGGIPDGCCLAYDWLQRFDTSGKQVRVKECFLEHTRFN